VRVLAITLLVAACGYRPGSFFWQTNPFVGVASTVGCLDIATSRMADSDVGPVLRFDFGNRCSGPTVVDFKQTRVEGVTVDGRRIALAPYDPAGGITEQQLDGRLAGHEAIAYESEARVVDVCVDLASIAHAPGELWRCVPRTEPQTEVAP